jgi:hypothetical protein
MLRGQLPAWIILEEVSMKRRKWQFTTREAAENAARDLSTQRDHLTIALNAALHGGIQWVDGHFGDEDAYYKFGLINRVAGCVVVVSFYCPKTGQRPHSAAYWESWVQEELDRQYQSCGMDRESRRYREGLYALRAAVNKANSEPVPVWNTPSGQEEAQNPAVETGVTVVVVWEHDYDEPHIQEYDFGTQAEADAFLEGMTETDSTCEWFHTCASIEEANAYLIETDRAQFVREKEGAA